MADIPVWLVTGYDEIVAVLTDPRFSNDLSDSGLTGAFMSLPEDLRPYFTATLAAYDPPDHTRLRKVVSREFTTRRVLRFRPRIEAITGELLDDLARLADIDGLVDLVEHFAHQLPIRVIGELLGVPAGDQHRWRSLAEGLTAGDPGRGVTSARGLVDYMSQLVTTRRKAEDGDDLLSRLIHVQEEDGDRLSDEELVALSLSILLAGHRTTAALIRTGALLLLSAPERFEALRNAPERIAAAVEEILRRYGPAEIGTLRVCREPVRLGGVLIPRGALVQVVFASANRDPRRFSGAEELDLTRADNAHLGFGHGIHYCLGAALARAVGEIAFGRLVGMTPRLCLATPAEELSLTPGLSPGEKALPVRFVQRADDPAPR